MKTSSTLYALLILFLLSFSAKARSNHQDITDKYSDVSIDCSTLADINVTLAPGEMTKIISWTNPTATTTCNEGGVLVTQVEGEPTGSNFSEGAYSIVFLATDNCSESEECSFSITVNPAPEGEITMSCPDDISISLAPGESSSIVSWVDATATTTCVLMELQIEQTAGPESGSALEAGSYTINYGATDACLAEEDCSFNITVNPMPVNEGPFWAPGMLDIDITLNPGDYQQVITWLEPTATTACSLGGLTITQIAGPTNGSALSEGTYTVIYEATDACLGLIQFAFVVNVNAAPTSNISMECPSNNIIITLKPGKLERVVTWDEPNVTTTCELEGLSVTQLEGPVANSTLQEGEYMVVYSAIDNCLSAKTCSFSITVLAAPTNIMTLDIDYVLDDAYEIFPNISSPINLKAKSQLEIDEIKLGPSPTTGAFKVDLSSLDGKQGALMIVDGLGNVVWNKQTATLSSNPIDINLSDLPNGLYHVIVTLPSMDDVKVLSQTIVLQK